MVQVRTAVGICTCYPQLYTALLQNMAKELTSDSVNKVGAAAYNTYADITDCFMRSVNLSTFAAVSEDYHRRLCIQLLAVAEESQRKELLQKQVFNTPCML